MIPRASQRVVAAAGGLLRALSAVRQTYALYPEGHPNREEAVREVVDRLRGLRADTGEDPVLFVARHSFYLGRSLLARASLSLYHLVETFERAGVHAVEVTDEATHEDVDALVGILEGRAPLRERLGALVLNRLEPSLPAGVLDQERLTELRRTYAMGLDLVRTTGARVRAGHPVDLQAATGVVEQLADAVVADPAHTLLLTTVKAYDEYTYYHMLNVCLLVVALGHSLGLDRQQLVVLGLGGLLHDVGKVNVPEEILTGVGRLDEEQWRLVQRHPVDGAGLLFGTREGLYHPAASAVLQHHAAYDLSGYPPLSRRSAPSLPARLVAVADCFDALTTTRAYRAATDRRQALEILEAGAGAGFDPRVVRVFARLLGLFPVGSLVRLDTGEVGLVVANHPAQLSRPRVLVVLDTAGNTTEPVERDLAQPGPGGGARWTVRETVDPEELGLDIMHLLLTGDVDEAYSPRGGPRGLVHEPSPGEAPPAGYVDTHNQGGHGHSHGE